VVITALNPIIIGKTLDEMWIKALDIDYPNFHSPATRPNFKIMKGNSIKLIPSPKTTPNIFI
jgi:hypothetical protein